VRHAWRGTFPAVKSGKFAKQHGIVSQATMIDSLFPNFRPPELMAAVDQFAADGETERGAVYTRPEVVQTILDLSGYTVDRPLCQFRLLEPSFGGGDFLLPVVDRLLASWRASGRTAATIEADLRGALVAVEVHRGAFQATRTKVLQRLERAGARPVAAVALVDAWLVCDDFLLTSLAGSFDFVVGNPPYVRQERIPAALLSAYRSRYETIYDRADLYVPFIERGLSLLRKGGRLGFICANRWLKNKYGGPLRRFAASNFRLVYFIDLEGSPAFHTDVIAYPAITIFERASSGTTRVAWRPEVSEASLGKLVESMLNGGAASDNRIAEVERAMSGADPWLLDSPEPLALLRKLEAAFPDLESAGCKVGIGVATGADAVYIDKYDTLPVEEDRKLPLVMARDLRGVAVEWRGYGVINPFLPDGTLADLDLWPRFGAYMRSHYERIAGRHCARKSTNSWYRTIDRIWPELTSCPKLLIPDIKGEPTVVFDEGRYYPHHNLYCVTSDRWDLMALATILRSSLAVLFISSYCVRMSGGFLRFQAQYLRRIRVPAWERVSVEVRKALRNASATTDLNTIDRAVALAYGLTSAEAKLIRKVADEARVTRKTDANSTAAL